jgi:hypothetical protein
MIKTSFTHATSAPATASAPFLTRERLPPPSRLWVAAVAPGRLMAHPIQVRPTGVSAPEPARYWAGSYTYTCP